jgi:hypothetical protein
MWIVPDNTVGKLEYLFRLELLFYHPAIGVRGILDGHQIADNVLHGRIQYGFGAAYSLGANNMSRLDKQHTKRHHEDGNRHQ